MFSKFGYVFSRKFGHMRPDCLFELLFGLLGSSEPHVCSLAHTSFYASILTISSIAVDRYLMVAHPFKHRFLINGKKAAGWIACIWLLGISSPIYYILTGTLGEIGRFKYGLLAAIIGITTILTCIALKRQANSLKNGEGRQAHKAGIAKEKRFVTTLVIIAAIAFACLTSATVTATSSS